MQKMIRIAGAGVCCVDHLLAAPRPAWGATSHAVGYRVEGGGLVGTAMVAAARLGARAEVATRVGDDAAGDAVLRGLHAEGVRTRGAVRVRGGGTPFSFIHVDARTGERTIFHRPAAGLIGGVRSKDLAFIDRCGALVVDDYYPDLSVAAARRARAAGVPVVGDFIPGRRSDILARYVDVLIVPSHYLGLRKSPVPRPSSPVPQWRTAALDSALGRIHALGPSTAIITLGADGGVWSDRSGRGRWKAFRVRVSDTTGAGDVFHGAFAYGVARGWDTGRSCEFAAAVSALKCTKPGGRAGIPTFGQAMAFLRKRQPSCCGGEGEAPAEPFAPCGSPGGSPSPKGPP